MAALLWLSITLFLWIARKYDSEIVAGLVFAVPAGAAGPMRCAALALNAAVIGMLSARPRSTTERAGSVRHSACFWPVFSMPVVSQSCTYSAWTRRISGQSRRRIYAP